MAQLFKGYKKTTLMQHDRNNPLPQEVNVDKNENTENANGERFESDTQKVVRQHLENEDHVITDEDIAKIRVGMVPPQFDRPTEDRISEAEERLGSDSDDSHERKVDKNLEDEKITPWDTIDPTK